MRPATSPPGLTTLVLLTAVSTLTLNMFVPALPTIGEDLGAAPGVIGLSIGAYLAVTAAVQLGIGPLSDRLGRRPVMLAALGVFTVASAGCALAGDVASFLAFRMAQGGAIAGYVLSLAILRDTREPVAAARAIAEIGIAMALAPMLGPALGGVVDQLLGWRAIFWLYALSGAGLLVLVWADLGETRPARSAASRPGRAGIALLLADRRFLGHALCVAFSTGAFYVFVAGAAQVATARFGVSSALLGVLIGSITCGFLTGSVLARRIAPGRAILIGRAVACGGMTAGLVLFSAGAGGPVVFFGATMLVGLGNGLTMPGASAGSLSVRPDLAGTAAGLTGALTVGIGAVLTSAAGPLVEGAAGAERLLALMLGASAAGLIAAAIAMGAEREAAIPD